MIHVSKTQAYRAEGKQNGAEARAQAVSLLTQIPYGQTFRGIAEEA